MYKLLYQLLDGKYNGGKDKQKNVTVEGEARSNFIINDNKTRISFLEITLETDRLNKKHRVELKSYVRKFEELEQDYERRERELQNVDEHLIRKYRSQVKHWERGKERFFDSKRRKLAENDLEFYSLLRQLYGKESQQQQSVSDHHGPPSVGRENSNQKADGNAAETPSSSSQPPAGWESVEETDDLTLDASDIGRYKTRQKFRAMESWIIRNGDPEMKAQCEVVLGRPLSLVSAAASGVPQRTPTKIISQEQRH